MQGPQRPRSTRALVCLLATFVLAGCGKDDLGKVVPVSGKVTLDGHPLGTVMVTFVPDSAKGNQVRASAFGVAEAGGQYTLKTRTASANPRDGAPVGWYRVTVGPAMPSQMPAAVTSPGKSHSPSVKMTAVPERYRNAKKTSLVVEVTESAEPGAYDLKLTTKRK